MSRKNIAIVGVGYWGKNLLRIFNQLGALKIICDIDKKILNQRKKDYPKIQITADFKEILKDKDIKGVVITTPGVSHYRLAEKALKAGKDVLVEKPLALKLEQGEKLLKLAKKRKKILMVDHLFLYHPVIAKIKELIKRDRLGKIYYLYLNRLNFGKIRTGEDALWSLAPHDISMIIEILGDLPTEVRATGGRYINKRILDIATADFKFKNSQILAKFFVTWLNPFKERKLVIVGSKGMLVFDDLIKDKLILYSYKIEYKRNKLINISRVEPVKSKAMAIKVLEEEPLMNAVKHFLECLNKRKKPKTDGEEACNVLRVLEACQESIKKNGKTIKL